MKLKKIISAVLASAVVTAGAAAAYAVEDGQAAYCFDNGTALLEWQTFGSVEETGFKMISTDAASKNGNGSLLISEAITDEVSEQYGGAYIEASTLGLENFKGCTVEMSVMLAKDSEAFCDKLSLFSDGIVWLTASPESLSSEEWTTVTLDIPEDAANSQVGFTIPTYNIYSGDIVYIDDFSITNAAGTVVANRGDYELKKVTEAEKVPEGTNLALTIGLVVLILVIVGGIGFIVSSAIKKFS